MGSREQDEAVVARVLEGMVATVAAEGGEGEGEGEESSIMRAMLADMEAAMAEASAPGWDD